MQTLILKADSPDTIRQAASLIRAGKLVAFPTETVYGLGADATNLKAVERIFIVKNRPLSDPFIVHISSMQMLKNIVKEIPRPARLLMDAFWPGPLTLILKKTEAIPGIVTANLSTMAVRMPGNTTALRLIAESDVPIAAPSANSFGRPSATLASHVMDDLGEKIEMVIDGGPCRIGVESTVVDINCTPPVILRPGAINRENLEKVMGKVGFFRTKYSELSASPGLMKQHYSPKARLLLFKGSKKNKVLESMKYKIDELTLSKKVGVLVPEEYRSRFEESKITFQSLGSSDNLDLIAKNLFSRMRLLDSLEVDYILTIAPPQQYIGQAIFDRLYKAAGSQIIIVD